MTKTIKTLGLAIGLAAAGTTFAGTISTEHHRDDNRVSVEGCNISCTIENYRTNRSKLKVFVSHENRGRCNGLYLVSAVGPDAQIFHESLHLNEYLRKGEIEELTENRLPYLVDSCRIDYSPVD